MKPLNPVSLQLWTIRNAMAADLDQALCRAKSAGFSAVEVAPLPEGITPEQLAGALERHRLAVTSIHGDLPSAANLDSWSRLTRVYGCRKIIWHGWPRDPRFDSLGGVREVLSAFNKAGAIARDQGYQFGLHNHWWEFESAAGETPIRIFHEALHPEIFWQLDVYWAKTAGADPSDVMRDLGPRLGSLHWKDGPAVQGEPMTALGRGTVDLRRVYDSLPREIDWVIELDECATDPLEAAGQGLTYLNSLRNG